MRSPAKCCHVRPELRPPSDLLDLGEENCGLALDMADSTCVRVTDVLATNGGRGKDTSLSSQPTEKCRYDGAIRQHCGVTNTLPHRKSPAPSWFPGGCYTRDLTKCVARCMKSEPRGEGQGHIALSPTRSSCRLDPAGYAFNEVGNSFNIHLSSSTSR